MAVIFHKLHSSGNDFIVLFEEENREIEKKAKKEFISRICHRNFGVGADGVFFVLKDKRVLHFDPDGSESFCVNGSLCLAFLKGMEKFKDLIPSSFSLSGVRVSIEESTVPEISFSLEKIEIRKLTVGGHKGVFVDIGNPHFFVKGRILPKEIAAELRHNSVFKNGANISFIEEEGGTIKISTYERGVEDFTLACGSACAAYLISSKLEKAVFMPPSGIPVEVRIESGKLFVKGEVDYVAKGDFFS